MHTQTDLGHHPATLIRQRGSRLIRIVLALGLLLALAPQPAPLHAMPVVSIPDEGPARALEAAPIASTPNPEAPVIAEESVSAPIAFDQLGVAAQKQYEGDGLAIVSTEDGVELRSAFQDLNGLVTECGLQLFSVADDAEGLPFAIKATALGRGMAATMLASSGYVEVGDEQVRFVRPGLVEEISTGADGIRQDFVLLERPAGQGELWLELAVTGAVASMTEQGIRLQLDDTDRELIYSRLHVSDASGRQLEARFEAFSSTRLAVKVDDSAAVWPLRIDPTFSDADWVSMGGLPGTNGIVYAIATNGADLFVGGMFTAVGDVMANNIAKWDGSTWSAFGTGMNGDVYALAVIGSDLYAGGLFTTVGGVPANYIAKWDGSGWATLGAGTDYIVWSLAVIGSDLYAGGWFTAAGGVAANYVAKWDGITWSALGSGMDSSVRALTVIGGDLYAGGFFATAGGVTANHIAVWDGIAWSTLGSGMDGDVEALAVIGNDLYAGGQFTTAGGVSARNIAKWDGSNWFALGSGTNYSVMALAVIGGNLYAGGYFSTAGETSAHYVAKWDGSTWSALGSGVEGFATEFVEVNALAVIGSDLYAGGQFNIAGDVPADYVAKWNGTAWSALDSGMDGGVDALAVIGSDLYAGGWFTTAGGVAVNYIAKWDGSAWSALGSGMDAPVYALAVIGGNLYAGGGFSTAGGVPANSIAKWDGGGWSTLGSGIEDYSVNALAVIGNDLFAGGWFPRAGGVAANNIAKWDGSDWSALGSGIENYSVDALAVIGSDLYAGGWFTMAGGVAANNIAKWDGSAWSALGSGLDDLVYALAVSDSDLYAGGKFSTAGGVPANYIAKWDGSAWSALGLGVGYRVYALAVLKCDLYAGGRFVTADGLPANRIAKWDGSAWSVLGSGMDNTVVALAVSGSDLYAGGSFTTAGNKVSAYAARALSPGSDCDTDALAAGYGKPWHTRSADLHIGDDNTLDDGASFAALPANGAYLVDVKVTNNSGAPAQLVGWVDIAGNGSFAESGDRSGPALAGADPVMTSGWDDAADGTFTTGNIPDGYSGTVTLQWTVSGTPAASTSARLRLATDPSFFSDASPQPTGLKGPGESEGHPVPATPLAVSLGYFLATRDGEQIEFVWQTATESGTAGFNLLAEVDGVRTQLNDVLIPSTAIDSVEPVDYIAHFASDAETFYLEEMDVSGGRHLYGPFDLGKAAGAVAGNGSEETMPSIYLPFVRN